MTIRQWVFIYLCFLVPWNTVWMPGQVQIKGTGHYWQLLKIIVSITKLILGNKQWRAVSNIKHCEKRLSLNERSSFRKRNYFSFI